MSERPAVLVIMGALLSRAPPRNPQNDTDVRVKVVAGGSQLVHFDGESCQSRTAVRLVGVAFAVWGVNPLMPSGAFNICCPRDCVSRTANVERTGWH